MCSSVVNEGQEERGEEAVDVDSEQAKSLQSSEN